MDPSLFTVQTFVGAGDLPPPARPGLSWLPTVRRAVVRTDPPPAWDEVLREMLEASAAPPSKEMEEACLLLLHQEGEFRMTGTLAPGAPRALPPEDMLKLIAAQWLAKYTGFDHLAAMQRMAARARNREAAEDVVRIIAGR